MIRKDKFTLHYTTLHYTTLHYFTYIHICICTYIHIYIYNHIYIIYNHIYTHIHIYTYTHKHMYTYIHIYIYNTYIHTHIYIYMYTYIHYAYDGVSRFMTNGRASRTTWITVESLLLSPVGWQGQDQRSIEVEVAEVAPRFRLEGLDFRMDFIQCREQSEIIQCLQYGYRDMVIRYVTCGMCPYRIFIRIACILTASHKHP